MRKRLAVAFALVGVLGAAVLGLVTWFQTDSQVANLVRARNASTTQGVVGQLAAAYAHAGGSWSGAELFGAHMIAASDRASLSVLGAHGRTVTGAGFGPGLRSGWSRDGHRPPMTGFGAPQRTMVVVSGRPVGTAVLRFPRATPAPEQQVRRALGQTVVWGGLLAAGIGVLVAAQITRPLRRLTGAAHALAAGDRAARAGGDAEPAELGALGRAFDQMATTIEREDGLRRAFAADVAHELRTPLAIAQGELEALVDGVVAPTPERLRSLHEEMVRLGTIVQDVETLAAAEAAPLRLRRQRVDLARVAGDAVERLHPEADKVGLHVSSSLAAAIVDADRTRLEQVTHNLLSNALKFTPTGGNVAVSVAAVDGHAQLTVEDTGPGLPDADLPHVFERFWRGDATREAQGSGVGLAVVAELVRAHGGSVQVANRAEGGARFTVTLPRA